MASENETVAEIVKRVRRKCNSYPLPTAAAEMLKLVRDIEAAHKREVAELNEAIESNLRVHKAAERADFDKKIELNGEIVRRDIVIAELRECLEEATSIRCQECFHSDHGRCDDHDINCMARKWRKALEGAKDETTV